MGQVGTQAVDRAAALLVSVVESPEPRSFTSLVDELGLARSTTSRLLQALERNKLVQRDRTGGFRAGSVFASFAVRQDRLADLVDLAQPGMERLGQLTGETINLAVPGGRGDPPALPGRRQLRPRRDELARRRRPGALLRGRQAVLRVRRDADAQRAAPPAYGCDHHHRARAVRPARGGAPRWAGPARSTSWSPAWSRWPLRCSTRTAPWSPASRSPDRPCGSDPTTSQASRKPLSQSQIGCPAAWAAARPNGPTPDRALTGRTPAHDDPPSPVRGRGEHERQEPHDARRDPQGPLRRDADRQRAAGARADPGGAGHRAGAGDDALRGPHPVARGGRRPLRAR